MAQARSISNTQEFSLRATIAQLSETIRIRRLRRRLFTQALKELSQLSDRELHEIGTGRHAMRHLAWEHAVLNAH